MNWMREIGGKSLDRGPNRLITFFFKFFSLSVNNKSLFFRQFRKYFFAFFRTDKQLVFGLHLRNFKKWKSSYTQIWNQNFLSLFSILSINFQKFFELDNFIPQNLWLLLVNFGTEKPLQFLLKKISFNWFCVNPVWIFKSRFSSIWFKKLHIIFHDFLLPRFVQDWWTFPFNFELLLRNSQKRENLKVSQKTRILQSRAMILWMKFFSFSWKIARKKWE